MTPKTKPILFVFLLLVASLVLGACAPQVVKDARKTATAIANNAEATKIVAEAQALLNGTPTPTPTQIPQFTPTASTMVAPQEVTVTMAPAQPAASQTCHKINDYQLQDLSELSVEPGGYLHVQWYVKDGDPERESVLPSGRYQIKTPLRGHVWEYSPSCTPEQVLDQVAGSIARRLDVGADNAGFAPWQEWLVGKGLIEVVKMTSSTVIPTALPNHTP